MKNVAVIIPTLNSGGAERMAANMSIELEKKYNVYVVVFSAESVMYQYGGTLIDLNIPPLKEASKLRRINNSIKRIFALRKIKKQYKIDCAISHLNGANLVNVLSRTKEKIVSVFHSMPSLSMSANKKNIFMHNFMGRHSDKYIMVSELAAYDMIHSFKVPDDKVSCIHNFCRVKDIAVASSEDISNAKAIEFYQAHCYTIITMGRLAKVKGQKNLIRAFSEIKKIVPDCGLIILGEGEERKNLEGLIKDLGLEADVYMPGVIENPFPYIKQSSVFVLSSLSEGLPMVLIEAAACGCPIVSTDMKSGAREVLAPDTDILYSAKDKEYAKFGILVPVCSKNTENTADITVEEKLMANAITEMIENEALRSKYIIESRECVDSYSPETIMKKWIALIEE